MVMDHIIAGWMWMILVVSVTTIRQKVRTQCVVH